MASRSKVMLSLSSYSLKRSYSSLIRIETISWNLVSRRVQASYSARISNESLCRT